MVSHDRVRFYRAGLNQDFVDNVELQGVYVHNYYLRPESGVELFNPSIEITSEYYDEIMGNIRTEPESPVYFSSNQDENGYLVNFVDTVPGDGQSSVSLDPLDVKISFTPGFSVRRTVTPPTISEKTETIRLEIIAVPEQDMTNLDLIVSCRETDSVAPFFVEGTVSSKNLDSASLNRISWGVHLDEELNGEPILFSVEMLVENKLYPEEVEYKPQVWVRSFTSRVESQYASTNSVVVYDDDLLGRVEYSGEGSGGSPLSWMVENKIYYSVELPDFSRSLSEEYTGEIHDITDDGSPVLFADGLDNIRGIAVDEDDHLWVIHGYIGELTEYSQDGTILNSYILGYPESRIAFHEGVMYSVDQGEGHLLKTELQDGNLYSTLLADGIMNPETVLVDSDGYVYVTEERTESVLKYDPTDWSSTSLFGHLGLHEVEGLAYCEESDTLYVGAEKLYRLQNNGDLELLFNPRDEPLDETIAIGPMGHLYVTTYSGKVYRVPPGADAYLIIDENWTPVNLAVDSNENLYLSDQQGRVFRYKHLVNRQNEDEGDDTVVASVPESTTQGACDQFYLTIISPVAFEGEGWYDEGEAITVTAKYREGDIIQKTFTRWTGDVESSSATILIRMDGSKTIKANYTNDYLVFSIIVFAVLIVGAPITYVVASNLRKT